VDHQEEDQVPEGEAVEVPQGEAPHLKRRKETRVMNVNAVLLLHQVLHHQVASLMNYHPVHLRIAVVQSQKQRMMIKDMHVDHMHVDKVQMIS